MKKTFFYTSFFLLLFVLMCACAPSENSVAQKPLNEYLIANSVDLTCMMDSLAQSTEYIELTTASPELAEFITKIGDDNYTSPNKAVLIKVPDATAAAAIENSAGKLNLPDDVHEMVTTRMLWSIPSMLNGQQGVMAIAATSVLSINKAFLQHEELTSNIYVVLIYDNIASVTFYRISSEGITSVSSTFLFLTDEMEKVITEESVIEYLSEASEISKIFNSGGVEVEYITGDTIASYR